MQRRDEIEGLRALAVIPVILFHARVPGFGGGFAGVDLFFVISGYLITATILEDVAAARFSFIDFYQRRARRLVPALLPVMAFSTTCAALIFIAEDFRKFGQALAASGVFAANLLFVRSVGYFDDDEGFQPLLHLWSLSVEEQFYLLFPLALVLLLKKRPTWLVPALSMTLIASLALAVGLAPRSPQWAFFLLPTRIWELMAGAICAALQVRGFVLRWRGIDMLGLGLIVAGFASISPQSAVPGLAFLLPVSGAALIILGADRASLAGCALRSPPLVALGGASYGIYLWHNPLLAFAGYVWFGPMPWIAVAAIICLACVLGFASLYLIERPVRQGERLRSGRSLAMFCLFGLTLAFALGLAAHMRWTGPLQRGGYPDSSLNAATMSAPVSLPQGPLRYVVYGDSHARQYAHALQGRFGRGAVLTESACLSLPSIANMPPTNPAAGTCIDMARRLVTLVRERGITTIYWAQRWDRDLFPTDGAAAAGTVSGSGSARFLIALKAMVDRLPAQTTIILIGNVPTAAVSAPQMAGGYPRCRAYLNVTCPTHYPRAQAEAAGVNALLARFAARHTGRPRVTYVDPAPVLCQGQSCAVVRRGRLVYADGSHLTPWAAAAVGATLPAPPPPGN